MLGISGGISAAVSFSLSPLLHESGDRPFHSLCTGRVCSKMKPTPTIDDGPTMVHRQYVVMTACSGVMIRKLIFCSA